MFFDYHNQFLSWVCVCARGECTRLLSVEHRLASESMGATLELMAKIHASMGLGR